MKVILLKDVKEQGKAGQLVEVSDGYARNFLIPRKLAVQANTDNVNALKQQEKKRAKQVEKEVAGAKAAQEKLESLLVKISAKAGVGGRLFGAVTSKEIAEALSEQHGISIEKNKIVQTEPIKTFGSYEVRVKLGHEISGTIHLVVAEGK
ncbi:MAG: 50S ribosomal protein L9 [Oscillospiraceae bacterium]|nr:50S ribosomal protein L9 [Oscillospiraceae bacterium]